MNHLMKVEEVSEHLRLTPETVRRLIKRGVLAGFRVGRCFRGPKEAVERLTRGDAESVISSEPIRKL